MGLTNSVRRQCFFGLIVSIALLARDPAAMGQDSRTAADVEILRGLALREQSRDLEAIDAFRRAHEIAPSPRALAQIGLAEQALGRWPQAELHVAAALQYTHDAWIRRNRVPLEQALEFIRARRLSAGATAAAGEAEARAVEPASHPPIVSTDPPRREPSHPGTSGAQTFGWVAVGGAAVALGIGIAGHVLRETHAARWNSDACVSLRSSREELCSGERSAANSGQILAIAGYAAAGALAITSALLLFTTSDSRERRAGGLSALRCGPGPGQIGASCGISF